MKEPEQYFKLVQERPSLFNNLGGAIFNILLDPTEIHKVETYMQQKLIDQGVPNVWARDWSQVGIVFSDQYLLLLRDAVLFPDGSMGTYIRWVPHDDSAPGVAILPVYNGQVLLVRHFRHATRKWHLEIPRGFGTPGKSTKESARQELWEETKAKVSQFTSLGRIYPDSGMTSSHVELFYAVVESYGNAEAYEAISEIHLITVYEFEHLIRSNEVSDSFTLAAYARAKLQQFL